MVTATRTSRRLDDVPVRTEVVGRDTVERRSRPERTIRHFRDEAIERPDIDPVLRSEVTIAQVHEDAARQPWQFADGAQASQLRRRESRLRLDFDGQEVTPAPKQEVDSV